MSEQEIGLERQLQASLDMGRAAEGSDTIVSLKPKTGARSRRKHLPVQAKPASSACQINGSVHPLAAKPLGSDSGTAPEFRGVEPLTLRQKLGEVRRRIGYIQKRGYNERYNYNYVTAADIAGAIGDILAELGVVIIPRLENITYEPRTPGRSDAGRVARVVMAYTFSDADSGEEITAKVAGEGFDAGDKAPYKAMTGALKYALLQSFLLATGDDPEDERADSRSGLASEHVITPEQVGELQALIEETGTDIERVLAYYKVAALGDLSETSYRRALEVLNRKLAKRSQENGTHAQN